MAQQTINIGIAPNSNTGDPIRTAFTKVNDNFTELYTFNLGQTAGSTVQGFVNYNATTKTAGQFYGGTTAPDSTTRLNFDGYIYATRLYGDGTGLTSLPAGNLTGTIPSAVLGNSSFNIGTTSIALNRSSGVQSLTGVSIDGNAGTVTNGVYTTGSYADPVWITSLDKAKVGLGNVTNESKATMFTNPTFTGTVSGVTATMVGLGNVENTALSTWAGSTNITTIGAATATSLSVTGNLTVNGTTTTVNSTTVTVDDPILTLGGDTAPTTDDNKDRGIEFRWHNGTTGKLGFFGFDDSTGKFTFIPDATNTSEVFSGTKGTIDANLEWADVLNKPDPVVTVTLTGDVTGTANATLTDLGNGTISIATTVAADSVALGTDTTGNYVASVATTAPLSGGAAGSEGAGLTLSLASGYGDTQNPFASKTANTFLAAPNGSAGAPTFRSIVAADIPTLNQSTTGNAATATNASNAWQLGTDVTTKSNALQYWQLNGNDTLNPTTDWHYAFRMSHGDAETYYSATLAFNFFSDTIQYRRKTNGTNASWVTLLHSGNYNSYSPTLTGTGASGTWGISVTGNAGTATTLATARNINGTSFNGSANITTASWGTARTITIGSTGKSVDGSGNVSWTLAEIGAQAAGSYLTAESDTLATVTARGNTATSASIAYFGVNNTTNTNGYGISLYNGAVAGEPTYGIMFQGTATFGNHGAVSNASDWATYFTMNNDNGRGWIFRKAGTGNTSSISAGGAAQFDISVRSPIFYDSNDTSFYLDPNATTSLKIAGNIEQGNNLGRPNIEWNASGSSTGMVIFSLPGAASTNYGMVHMVFDYYEYVTGRTATVILGGHNWSTSWYENGCTVIGNLPKEVRLGVKDGKYCVVFGVAGSTWNYGTIRLRKIHNAGFYDNVLDVGGSYSVSQTTTESFTNVTGDLRQFYTPKDSYAYAYRGHSNVAGTGEASFHPAGVYSTGTNWLYGSIITNNNTINSGTGSISGSIFYDSNDTNYYIDPASTASNALKVRGGALFGPNTSWSASLYVGTNGSVDINTATVAATNGNLHLDAANGYVMYLNNYATSSYTIAQQSMRSPIFYDSNDTTYYIDPAGNGTRAAYLNGNLWINPKSESYGEGIAFNMPTQGVWGGIRWVRGGTQPANWAFGYFGNESNNDIGFHNGSNGWRLDHSFNNTVTGSVRSPIFYDSNDTGYYWDGASTSRWNESNQNGWHTFNNYGLGVTGTYDSTRLQTVFAMGSAYRMAADGTATSNMYGIAWSHPNAGTLGGANNLNDHGILIINNGGFRAAISSRAVFSADVRGTLFYDYNDTGYYCDPNSSSYLHTLLLSGASYFRPQNWIQLDSAYGLYWPNTNGAHVQGNDLSSYGSIAVRGSRSGWRGIHFYDGGNVPHLMFDGSANGGIYFETGGRWASYYSYSNNCWGFGTSSTSSAYNIYCPTGVYSGGRSDGTIFYDANDTGYYCDPNSTSRLLTLNVVGDITVGVGQTSSNIYFTDSDEGTRRMHCNSNRIGFLNDSNGWGSYCGDGGEWYSDQSVRSPIFYDNDNTGYYADPASTSQFSRVNANDIFYGNGNWSYFTGIYDTNDTAWYIDPNGTSLTNDFRANIFYDRYDTNYYAQPRSVSYFNDFRPNIIYDRNDTDGVIDPVGHSRLKTAGHASSGNVSALEIKNTGGTGDADVAAISWHCANYWGLQMHLRHDGYFGIGGWSASTWRWYVDTTNGNMTAAGNVTAYSDPRLKEEVTPITSPIEKIKQLTGVHFRWKEISELGKPGSYDYGVLATDVEKIAPELVCESAITSPDGDRYKTVAYDKLTPFLIEAVKEQQKIIDTQEERINRLEKLVEKLTQ